MVERSRAVDRVARGQGRGGRGAEPAERPARVADVTRAQVLRRSREQHERDVASLPGVRLVPRRKRDALGIDALEIDEARPERARRAASAEHENGLAEHAPRLLGRLGIGDQVLDAAERELRRERTSLTQHHGDGAEPARGRHHGDRARPSAHQHADALADPHAGRDQPADDGVDAPVGVGEVVSPPLEEEERALGFRLRLLREHEARAHACAAAHARQPRQQRDLRQTGLREPPQHLSAIGDGPEHSAQQVSSEAERQPGFFAQISELRRGRFVVTLLWLSLLDAADRFR